MRPIQILASKTLLLYFASLTVSSNASSSRVPNSDHFAFSCGPQGLIHHTNETNGLTPNVTIICPKMPVMMDTRAEVTCEVISSSYANITWYHNGQLISHKKKHKSHVKADRKTCNQTLKIKRPGTNDNGNYTCVVVNSVGEVTKTCPLVVKVDELKQVHVEYLKIAGHRKKAFLGGRVTLTCSISNSFDAVPVWRKNGKKITSDRHVWRRQHFSDRRVIIKFYLEISNVTKDDEGLYMCSGHANGMSDNKTLYLQTEPCPHRYYCPHNVNIAFPCPPSKDDCSYYFQEEEPCIASVVNTAGLSSFHPKHASLLLVYALLVIYTV